MTFTNNPAWNENKDSSVQRSNLYAQWIIAATMFISLVIPLLERVGFLAASSNSATYVVIASGFSFFVVRWVRLRLPIWKRNSTAKRKKAELVSLASEFNRLVTRGGVNNIVTVYEHLRNQEGWRGIDLSNPQLHSVCEYGGNYLMRRLEGPTDNFSEFSQCYDELASIVNAFASAYFQDAFYKIQNGKLDLLQHEDKRGIEAARESFSAFVRKFQTFSHDLKKDFGEHFPRYIQIPMPL